MEIENLELLQKLYKDLCILLDYAPLEENCSDKENEVYNNIANLKNSLENLGGIV